MERVVETSSGKGVVVGELYAENVAFPMGLVWYTCYVVRETCVKSRVYWVVSNFGIRDSR